MPVDLSIVFCTKQNICAVLFRQFKSAPVIFTKFLQHQKHYECTNEYRNFFYIDLTFTLNRIVFYVFKTF